MPRRTHRRATGVDSSAGRSTVTVTIEKMAAGGDALARLADGRVVFVNGALPGEVVVAHVTADKRDYARASADDIVEASPDRVDPPCPALARGCGGCSWQHVAPDAQLLLKVAVVEEALRRTGGLRDPEVRAGSSVAPWAYRTTMRTATAPDGRLGLRAVRSQRVVALDACLVAHPLLADLLERTRVRGATEVTLRVGAATGERTVLAHSAGASIDGLAANVGIGPDAAVHEDVAGVRLRISAPSFFQSGPQAATLLVDAVRAACGPELLGGPLLDAYGGVGLFAATIGGSQLTVVDSSRSACADAEVNLIGRNARVVFSAIEQWKPEPVPLVIADPARTGLGRAGVERLVGTAAERIVLVSCDAVSLARDASLLTQSGFAHDGSVVLDLFPHTPHVEVVTVFRRVRNGRELR